jgi:hypothetical protein
LAVPSWFRDSDDEENPDDVPTGQIAAVGITRIIEEADGKNGTENAAAASSSRGTEPATTTSESDVHPVSGTTGSAQAGLSALDQALADRRSLIQLCLYAMDRARSGGVAERIEHGLAGIGVRALRPDGERFDPAVHEAGGAMPTDDAALVGVVAETEVAGFADCERLLRPPIVTVYTKRIP